MADPTRATKNWHDPDPLLVWMSPNKAVQCQMLHLCLFLPKYLNFLGLNLISPLVSGGYDWFLLIQLMVLQLISHQFKEKGQPKKDQEMAQYWFSKLIAIILLFWVFYLASFSLPLQCFQLNHLVLYKGMKLSRRKWINMWDYLA